MLYYNLKVAVELKEDIRYEDTYEKIANYISKAMLYDEKLKKLHEENRYKFYNFCSLYPVEKDGIYKKGSMYLFDIRFIDLKFAMQIKTFLNINQDKDFKILMGQIQTIEYKPITKLITLTPAILTTDIGDYKINNDLELVKKRVINAAEKKYKKLYDVELKSDFIKDIKITNNKPIKLPYKNMHFLANKFEIDIKPDENSQKLAHLILATGVLEKNSLGFGFCKAK